MLYGSRDSYDLDSEIKANKVENFGKTLSASTFRLFCK